MSYKWCAVPKCLNTSIKTSGKMFICVPKSPKRRRKWLNLARRDPRDIVATSSLFFCEDHFNLEKDMANYMQYKMGFSKNILLKKDVLPSKFDCQEDRKRRLSEPSTSRAAFAKRQKIELVQEQLIMSEKRFQDNEECQTENRETINMDNEECQAESKDPINMECEVFRMDIIKEEFCEEAIDIIEDKDTELFLKTEIKEDNTDFDEETGSFLNSNDYHIVQIECDYKNVIDEDLNVHLADNPLRDTNYPCQDGEHKPDYLDESKEHIADDRNRVTFECNSCRLTNIDGQLFQHHLKYYKFCVVKNCQSTNHGEKKLSFFKFPKDPILKEKWTEELGLNVVKATDFVCEKHFKSEQVKRGECQRNKEGEIIYECSFDTPKLAKNAIPNPLVVNSEDSLSDEERTLKVTIANLPAKTYQNKHKGQKRKLDLDLNEKAKEIEVLGSDDVNCENSEIRDLTIAPTSSIVTNKVRNIEDLILIIPKWWIVHKKPVSPGPVYFFLRDSSYMDSSLSCNIDRGVSYNSYDSTLTYFIHEQEVDINELTHFPQTLNYAVHILNILRKFEMVNLCSGIQNELLKYMDDLTDINYKCGLFSQHKNCKLIRGRRSPRCKICSKFMRFLSFRKYRTTKKTKAQKVIS